MFIIIQNQAKVALASSSAARDELFGLDGNADESVCFN
jgi:hypothetical protein